MKKRLLFLLISFVFVLTCGFFVNKRFSTNENDVSKVEITPSGTIQPSLTNAEIEISPTPSPAAIPDSYLISNFPFQSQAPFANWDQLHDEACEEATLALVYFYLNNKPMNASAMDSEILKMVSWEESFFGSHKDLNIEELSQMASEYYKLDNYKIEKNITIEDIKREVSNNHPVIVPTAGRMLGNPNFRQPGPIYHMVVVIGYDGNRIIVQDVGTRNGNRYEYSEKIFFNAIHNWAGNQENIENGAKTMLVF